MSVIIPDVLMGWVRDLSRPAFIQYIKSQYMLAGYSVTPGINIDISPEGLDWVRTLNLTHVSGYTMQIIDPQDLHVIVGDYPTETQITAMYGYPGAMV